MLIYLDEEDAKTIVEVCKKLQEKIEPLLNKEVK